MSLVIFIGHSGDKVAADPSRINTLEALRAFVEKRAGIAPNKQVFLTAKGKQVRPQTLLTENEIYAFDSSLLAPSPPSRSSSALSTSTSSLPPSSSKEVARALDLIPAPAPHEPGQPPDSITNQTDLQAWRALFASRLEWANSLRDACAALVAQAQKHAEEQTVIEKSLSVAVNSLTNHTRGAEEKHAAAEEWCEDLLGQQERAVDRWEKDLGRLEDIPARLDFARFVLPKDKALDQIKGKDKEDTTLRHFVDVQDVNQAGSHAKQAMISFAQRVADLRTSLTAAGKASQQLLSAVDQMNHPASAASSSATIDSADDPKKPMEEIDIIVNKMRNDLEHVSSLPPTSQGLSRASKMALLHTRNYLPTLSEFCEEVNHLVRRIVDSRNSAAETSITHMQTLASIEGKLSHIFHAIKALEIPEDDQRAFNTINVLVRLPYVYGSLLVEAVRRREWAAKMKKDSSTLAEEMATYQEEEARRRKKWLLSIDDVVNPDHVATKPMGIELTLQSDENNWPTVSRQELQDYLNLLKKLDLPADVVQDLSTAIQDLDRPTKKQVRLARNAFKNGSVHDAAFGSTSLMLRGGDEQKVLREINTKLEDDLRAQRSRIRKLEDLLHRQANMQRIAGSGEGGASSSFSPMMELVSNQGMSDKMGTPPMSAMPFPHRPNDDSTRPPSSIGSIGAGSRRTSTTLATQTEEKKMARRIVNLESELQQAKQQSAYLEKEKNALEQDKLALQLEKQKSVDEEGSKKAQYDEAMSTKKDIMENMEAQQREFADARRVLEQELAAVRSRAEEIEDELERVIGSRDHVDPRTKALELELDQVRYQAEEDEKSRAEQVEELRRQLSEKNEQCQVWKDKCEEAQRVADEYKLAKEAQEQAHTESVNTLTAAHKNLSPHTPPPEKYVDLVSALEHLARTSSDNSKESSDQLELLKSERQSLQSQHEAQSREFKATRDNYAILEAELIRLRDEMASERAHTASLSSCLDDEREQLRDLRSKIASGEAGIELLRKRVEEEEDRVVTLTEKLAEAEAHGMSMDVELMRVQGKYNQAQTEINSANQRLERRGSRAKEVSQKLYAQNTRLLRLLDQLGFMVSRKEDGTMVIERASKVNNTTSTTLDPSSSMIRSAYSSPPPMGSRKTSLANANESIDLANLSFLHWSESSDAATEETAYAYFLQQTSLFDPQIFSEALSKRLRDFEYTARKWSKEAKSFSSLAARLKHENNQKIAVNNFKEGDLALFLPTRGENKGAWAAFNIGAPHHFLREREGMALSRREWLVARISRVEERVVDLKNGSGVKGSGDSLRSIGSTSVDAASLDERRERDDDNPFELSDGLTWYMVYASEDKAGAPSTPGLGKVTVASSSVDARGSIRMGKKKEGIAGEAVKTLGNVKSLDSRRSSEASRKSGAGPGFLGSGGGGEARRVPSDQSAKGLGILPTTSPATSTTSPAENERDRDQQHQHQHTQSSSSSTFSPPSFLRPRPHQRGPSSSSGGGGANPLLQLQNPQHQRAHSPSKSIRSLARHLEQPSQPLQSSQLQSAHVVSAESDTAAELVSAAVPNSPGPRASASSPSKRRTVPLTTMTTRSPQPGAPVFLPSSAPGPVSQMAAAAAGESGTHGRKRSASTAAGAATSGASERDAELKGNGGGRDAGAGAGAGNNKSRKGGSLWNLFSLGGEYEL